MSLKIPALALSLSAFSLGACAEVERANGGDPDTPVDRAGEPCELHEDSAPCGTEDAGIQYCAWNIWGECLTEEPSCELGDSKFAYTSEYCGDMFTNCVLDMDGVPIWFQETCDTPLVMDFGEGIDMIPVTDESFDISVIEDSCQNTDWPAAQTPWLALDRDQSGTIDDGTELFGSGTRLADGRRARHGFEALAELDDNGDGKITMLDAAFSRLVLWADFDADRVSSGSELTTLDEHGITSIDIDYVDLVSCDERGNCGRQRAQFMFGPDAAAGQVVDVHLPCQ